MDHLSKNTKIALGLATFWPSFYMLIFIVGLFIILAPLGRGGAKLEDSPPFLADLIEVFLFTMLEQVVLIFIYLAHLFKTRRVSRDKKMRWAAALILFNTISLPLYWYLFIWRESPSPLTGFPPWTQSPTFS